MAASWSPDSWRSKPIVQVPDYPDAAALAEVEAKLATFPPLVFAGEARELKKSLAAVAAGNGFLLQGGDCAESFAEHRADNIRDFFRVFLQMAVVLTYAGGSPVVKVGRIAGQFAKPRSSPIEKKRDGVELPSYRGDIINGPEFTAEARIPDPVRQIEAYRQSAATLNLIRAFATGGYADLERVHQWNMGFVKDSPQGHRYQALADRIAETLGFMRACGITSENTPQLQVDEVLHEPRGAAARLRAGDDAPRFARAATGTRPRATCCGSATARASSTTPTSSSAAASRIRSASSAGLRSSRDGLLRLLDILNPKDEPGRVTLICRFGHDKVGQHLPKLIRAVSKAGKQRRLVVRSHARQHDQRRQRLQDAPLRPHPEARSRRSSTSTAPRARTRAASTSR